MLVLIRPFKSDPFFVGFIRLQFKTTFFSVKVKKIIEDDITMQVNFVGHTLNALSYAAS